MPNLFDRMSAMARRVAKPFPHDVDPAIWTRKTDDLFVRADGGTLSHVGRNQWCATYPAAWSSTQPVNTTKGAIRRFPSAGAAARYLALHHAPKGGA